MQKTVTGRALEFLFPKKTPLGPSSIAGIQKLGIGFSCSSTIDIFDAEKGKFTIVASGLSKVLLNKLAKQFPEVVWERNGVLRETVIKYSGDILSTVKGMALTAAKVSLYEYPYEAHFLNGFTYGVADFSKPGWHVMFWLKLPTVRDGALDAALKIARLLPNQSWLLTRTDNFEVWLMSVLEKGVLQEAVRICERRGATRDDTDFEPISSPVMFLNNSGADLMLLNFRCPDHWLLLFVSNRLSSLTVEACRLCLHLDQHGKSRMVALAEIIGLEVITKEDLVYFDDQVLGRRP